MNKLRISATALLVLMAIATFMALSGCYSNDHDDHHGDQDHHADQDHHDDHHDNDSN